MSVHGFRLTSKRILSFDPSASSLDELTGRVSDGFYSTFTTLSGGTRVLGLRAHLKRLYGPARKFHIHPAVNQATLRRYIAELAAANRPGESRIRLILTKDRGDMYLGILPFTPLSESVYRDGVQVVTAEMARHDPRIKGTDFIAQSAGLRKLIAGGVYEALLTRDGKILEGMTSNFYAVISATESKASQLLESQSKLCGTLVTAQKGILLGVTRRVVIRLARGEGMRIEYRPPRVDEDFDEAFLTSSSRGVVPIVAIDGKPVGQGRPGAQTKRLSLAYQAYVRERSEEIFS